MLFGKRMTPMVHARLHSNHEDSSHEQFEPRMLKESYMM